MTRDAILVIDDEAVERDKMVRALGDEPYQILQGEDYDTGLSVFELHTPEIRALIVDVTLPGKNGCELAKTLLKNNPDLRVLFVSGHVGTEVIRFYGINASDLFFLRKPFQPQELVTRVREVLESTAPLPSVIMQSGTAS